MKLDDNIRYSADYEFMHFVCTKENIAVYPHEKREVFAVEKTFKGYPQEIALSVRYYMGHYGAIQGKLLREMNEITN